MKIGHIQVYNYIQGISKGDSFQCGLKMKIDEVKSELQIKCVK